MYINCKSSPDFELPSRALHKLLCKAVISGFCLVGSRWMESQMNLK